MQLTMDSPISNALQELPWKAKEMDALQDFLSSSPEGSLLVRWLEAVKRSGKNSPIEYEYITPKRQNENIARERFTIRLPKLNRFSPLLIQRIPEKLYIKFAEWKWEKLRELRASSRAGIWPQK
jgi:hypothetical protein